MRETNRMQPVNKCARSKNNHGAQMMPIIVLDKHTKMKKVIKAVLEKSVINFFKLKLL